MLRSAARVAVGAALWLSAPAAHAQSDEPEGALRRPERQTVSAADDMLGQLSPDGQTLYFVSNRNERSEIFAQNVGDGRARLLFDDNADVTWPRVSPDGKLLLYVSFGERIRGELCVRRLPDGGDRRCLADGFAVTQAEWIDRSRLVAVSRRSLHGDLRVLEVAAGAKLSARTLLDRNLTGLAVSPDGRWLVYVPIERDVPGIGPAFAAHVGRRLEAVRLDAPAAPPVPLAIDLPGLTGQPAFARDGRSITVVQFVADTNHDGVIDANDNGVLFRVPFAAGGGTPSLGAPEQLTEPSSNCEYPAPAAERLIATCAKRRGLEVYALPLEGEAPADWSAARLEAEIETAASRSEQALLASLRLARETSPAARRVALLALVRLHGALDQYDAAAFYADRLADLGDAATEGLAPVVRAFVDERRVAHDRARGTLAGGFAAGARQRLEELRLSPNASPMAIALAHVVRSEISDAIGDKAEARAELEAATLDASVPAPIVEAYYERADALYRALDDREALVRVCRRLAELSALGADPRLRYARAAVRAMVRGLPFDAAAAHVAKERGGAAPGSELAFALDAAQATLAIREPHPPPRVTEALLALYAQQSRVGRRHALVEETVVRASQTGADEVVEALAARYILDARRGTPDRRPAERLYRRVMSARALRRAGERRFAEARADFDAVAAETDSYEAVASSIDLRLGGGESPAAIVARYTTPETAAPVARFARAYVLARALPAQDGEAAARMAAEAMALLGASWAELAGKRIVHAVAGAILHDRYLRTRDLAFAERANVQYGIALELMGRGSSLRAMVLGQLGLLHTQVGNYRIAIGYLEERDTFPYAAGAGDLAVHLAHARALLHVGRAPEAATVADRAVAVVDRQPALAPYALLALDRAAVSNLAAERFARALALYDVLVPRLDAATGPAAVRNRFVARLARATAAIGAEAPERGLADLDEVDRALSDPAIVAALEWPHGSEERVAAMYRLLVNGLRARAYRACGRLEDEAAALEARRRALDERFVATRRAEDERSVMLAELQLALNARDRRDRAAAASWLAHALARADDLRARAHGQVDDGQLDVLWLAAQLTVETRTPIVKDLAARLDAAARSIAASHDARLRTYGRWFETYIPVVGGITESRAPRPP